MHNSNGITLLEDDEPWYKNKKDEYDNSPKREDFVVSDTISTTQDNGNEDNNDRYLFNIIACSLLFIISLIISLRLFWK